MKGMEIWKVNVHFIAATFFGVAFFLTTRFLAAATVFPAAGFLVAVAVFAAAAVVAFLTGVFLATTLVAFVDAVLAAGSKTRLVVRKVRRDDWDWEMFALDKDAIVEALDSVRAAIRGGRRESIVVR